MSPQMSGDPSRDRSRFFISSYQENGSFIIQTVSIDQKKGFNFNHLKTGHATIIPVTWLKFYTIHNKGFQFILHLQPYRYNQNPTHI